MDKARRPKRAQLTCETIAKRRQMFAEWFENVREMIEEG